LSEGADAERSDIDAVFDSRAYAARFGITGARQLELEKPSAEKA